MVKYVITQTDGETAYLEGKEKPLQLPKNSGAVAGDFVYVGKCGSMDVILAVHKGGN